MFLSAGGPLLAAAAAAELAWPPSIHKWPRAGAYRSRASAPVTIAQVRAPLLDGLGGRAAAKADGRTGCGLMARSRAVRHAELDFAALGDDKTIRQMDLCKD